MSIVENYKFSYIFGYQNFSLKIGCPILKTPFPEEYSSGIFFEDEFIKKFMPESILNHIYFAGSHILFAYKGLVVNDFPAYFCCESETEIVKYYNALDEIRKFMKINHDEFRYSDDPKYLEYDPDYDSDTINMLADSILHLMVRYDKKTYCFAKKIYKDINHLLTSMTIDIERFIYKNNTMFYTYSSYLMLNYNLEVMSPVYQTMYTWDHRTCTDCDYFDYEMITLCKHDIRERPLRLVIYVNEVNMLGGDIEPIFESGLRETYQLINFKCNKPIKRPHDTEQSVFEERGFVVDIDKELKFYENLHFDANIDYMYHLDRVNRRYTHKSIVPDTEAIIKTNYRMNHFGDFPYDGLQKDIRIMLFAIYINNAVIIEQSGKKIKMRIPKYIMMMIANYYFAAKIIENAEYYSNYEVKLHKMLNFDVILVE